MSKLLSVIVLLSISLFVSVFFNVGEASCANRNLNEKCNSNQTCWAQAESSPNCYSNSNNCTNCTGLAQCILLNNQPTCKIETKCPRCYQGEYCYQFYGETKPKCYKTSPFCNLQAQTTMPSLPMTSLPSHSPIGLVNTCKRPKICLQYGRSRGQFKCVLPY